MKKLTLFALLLTSALTTAAAFAGESDYYLPAAATVAEQKYPMYQSRSTELSDYNQDTMSYGNRYRRHGYYPRYGRYYYNDYRPYYRGYYGGWYGPRFGIGIGF